MCVIKCWFLKMTMRKFRDLCKDYILLLKLVGENSIPDVARELNSTEGAVRSKLYRCRNLINNCQWFVNNVRSLQKSSARIRKFTTSGELKEEMI